MKVSSFPLKITHHFEYNLSKIPIPDNLLGHRTDMVSFTLIRMIELLDHTNRHAAFVA